MTGFSDTDETVIQLVSISSAAVGLSGAAFMIFMFIISKNLQSFSYRLILYLAISDFGDVFAFLVGPSPYSAIFCQFQATFRSFFRLCSVLWIDIIAWTLYRGVVHQYDDIKKLEKRIIFTIIAYALGVALLPLITSSYGPSMRGYCWLTESSELIYWQMIQFYIPLWLSFVFASFCYYKVYKSSLFLINSVRDIDQQTRQNQLKSAAKLNFYPLTLVIAFFFATVNRFYLFFGPPNVVLMCLDCGFANLIGLFNCLVYGLSSKVKDSLKNCCKQSLEEVQEMKEISHQKLSEEDVPSHQLSQIEESPNQRYSAESNLKAQM